MPRKKKPQTNPWSETTVVHEFGVAEDDEPLYRLVAPKGSTPGGGVSPALEKRLKNSRNEWAWVPAPSNARTHVDLIDEIHSLVIDGGR